MAGVLRVEKVLISFEKSEMSIAPICLAVLPPSTEISSASLDK